MDAPQLTRWISFRRSRQHRHLFCSRPPPRTIVLLVSLWRKTDRVAEVIIYL
jgi:hypothetical protein